MNLPAHKKMLSAAAAASVLLLTAACGSSDSEGAASTDTETSAPTSSGETTDSADASVGDAAYADGTYEASGSYSRPSGMSEVDVSITVADGLVSEVEVTPKAEGTSRQFQEKFVGGISAEVVGKSLDEISVSKVAGSSLTSQGFNAALEEIKSEASA